MTQKTQSDCEVEFRAALLAFEMKLDALDEDTPWSERGLGWWVELDAMRQTTHAIRERLGYTKGNTA